MESLLQSLCGLGESQSHMAAELKRTLPQPIPPKASKDQFSASIMRVPGTHLSLAGLAASVLSAKPSGQPMSKDQVIDVWLAAETHIPSLLLGGC